jgi:hypothetical protein
VGDAVTLPKGHRSLLDPAFRYTPASSTDVARTFARLRREQKQRELEAVAIAEEQSRVVAPLPKRKARP